MSKQRSKENSPYPKNWRLRKRGLTGDYVFSYRAPKSVRHLWGGKAEPELGRGKTKTQAEKAAFETWAKKIQADVTPMTMAQLFDKYAAEVVTEKAPKTQESNLASIKRLRAVHGDLPVTEYETYMAYQYKEQCAKDVSKKTANLDLQVLSHTFTKAFEWGVPIKEHPIKQKVTKFSLPPRDRYIEDWELKEFLSVANPMLQAYVPIKYATGKDKSMVLRIKLSDITEDGLNFPKRGKVKTSANAKASFMPFKDKEGNTTGLKELIDDVITWRKEHLAVSSIWLFCTSQGQPYIKEDGKTSGFNSIWQRAMKKALDDTKLEVKFTEHDLCSKSASDVDTVEQAAALRGHTNTKTTRQNYRVKPDVVMPINRNAKK